MGTTVHVSNSIGSTSYPHSQTIISVPPLMDEQSTPYFAFDFATTKRRLFVHLRWNQHNQKEVLDMWIYQPISCMSGKGGIDLFTVVVVSVVLCLESQPVGV